MDILQRTFVIWLAGRYTKPLYGATGMIGMGYGSNPSLLLKVLTELLQLCLTAEDFTVAQVGFTPLSLRDVKLQKSDVSWSDIGGPRSRLIAYIGYLLTCARHFVPGLHETRRVLRETLEWPTKYGAIFAKCPLRLRSG